MIQLELDRMWDKYEEGIVGDIQDQSLIREVLEKILKTLEDAEYEAYILLEKVDL